MDTTLTKICGLLKSPDLARRCGAALVLAELAPKNAEVVRALGEGLAEANEQLAGCILEALQAIGSPAAVPFVMPLLASPDMTLRMRAVGILACGGDAVVPQVKEQLATAKREQKLILVDLLARIHSRETCETLLEMLFEPDFGLVKETCDAVRRHAAGATPAERLKLHAQVAKFMASPRVQKVERVLTSSLLLLGHIGRPEAAALLLKYATPKTSLYVRRHALIALKGVEYAGKTAGATLTKVLPYLDEADEDIARHALGILERMPEGSMAPTRWRSLLKSRHASVRALAAHRLAGPDTADNNALLLELLRHDDVAIRDVAAQALEKHEKAAPLLVKALAAEKDKDAAWTLARILKAHPSAADKKSLKKFVDLAAKALLEGEPRYEALLFFVRNLDASAADSVLVEAGTAHRKAKRWGPAVECFRRLLHTPSFTDDISYALSVCDLKVSHKELASQYRAEDHALRGFSALLRRNSASLLERMKKDKSLDAADLYYVGFHFAEGTGDEPAFGHEILRHLATTWPKSKEAKAVRERGK